MDSDGKLTFTRWFSTSYLMAIGWTAGLALITGVFVLCRLYSLSWSVATDSSVAIVFCILILIFALPKYRALHAELDRSARRRSWYAFVAGILIAIILTLVAKPILLIVFGMSAITLFSFAALHALMPQIRLGDHGTRPD